MALTREKLHKLLKFLMDEQIEISDVLNLSSKDSTLPLINQESETEMVDIREVYYVQQQKHNLHEIRTVRGTYSYKKGNIDIMTMVYNSGDFKYLEKNLLVNMEEIKCYDSFMELIYFSEHYKRPDAPKVRIKGVTMKHIIKLLGQDKDVSEHKIKTLSCAATKKYSM